MRENLVLLSFCSAAALATSLKYNVFFERDTCTGTNYTSQNGLAFDLRCGETIVGLDTSTAVIATGPKDIYACADACSTSRVCYFAVFDNSNATCMWSPKLTTVSLQLDTQFDVVVVNPMTQLTVPYDTTCPYANLSTVTTYNGMKTEIFCGLDILGIDYCPVGNSSCPAHATSLEECLDICSESHPLCWAVAYDPTLVKGYANCYLKNQYPWNNFVPSGALDPNYGNATLHSAVVTVKNGTSIPINCTNNAQLTAKDGQIFVTSCNINQTNNDLWQIHEETIEDCLDTCASWDGGDCKAVVYDTRRINGWENCWLKNGTSVGVKATGMTLAVMGSNSGSSGSNPGNGGSAGESKTASKAWIAGPVIGVIVVLGAVAYGITWRRKRSASPGTEKYEKGSGLRGGVAGKPPVWGSEGIEQRRPLNEMDGEQRVYPGEMDGENMRSPIEMSG